MVCMFSATPAGGLGGEAVPVRWGLREPTADKDPSDIKLTVVLH